MISSLMTVNLMNSSGNFNSLNLLLYAVFQDILPETPATGFSSEDDRPVIIPDFGLKA